MSRQEFDKNKFEDACEHAAHVRKDVVMTTQQDKELSSEQVEIAAQAIYEAFEYQGSGTKPAWYAGGNSQKQDEARRYARAALSQLPVAEQPAGQAITDEPHDANWLEREAKARPDECFLKGSGVLKLIGGIRQLERGAREQAATIQKLQTALDFWLPRMPDSPSWPDMRAIRIEEDSYLLCGSADEDKPCAEQLGWITLNPMSSICDRCAGTGLADSGGTMPWDEAAMIPCDCTTAPARSDAPLSPVAQMSGDDACHNEHCNQGEYEGSCKYGEAETCPAFASHPSNAAGQDAPAAWVHEEDPSRVISAAQKQQALRDGGASASSVKPYSIAAVVPAATVPQVVQAPVAFANWKVGTKSYVPYRTIEEARESVKRSEISATQEGPYEVVGLIPMNAAAPQPVATRESERDLLVKQFGECCMGADPYCIGGGCLVEKAIRKSVCQADADAVDAKRYRYLRDQAVFDNVHARKDGMPALGEGLDCAVDAAMAAQSTEGAKG